MTPVFYPSPSACLNAVTGRQAEAAALPTLLYEHLGYHAAYAGLTLKLQPQLSTGLCLSVCNSNGQNALLQNILLKAVSSVSQDTVNALVRTNSLQEHSYTFADRLYSNRTWVTVVTALLATMLPDKAEGLLLMDAYLYGDYLTQQTLTVYGTFNAGLEKNIYYTDNIVKIEGDNHAQFGNYGRQKGDPDATISADEQPRITVQAIADFITAKKVRLSCQTFRPYERSFSHARTREAVVLRLRHRTFLCRR